MALVETILKRQSASSQDEHLSARLAGIELQLTKLETWQSECQQQRKRNKRIRRKMKLRMNAQHQENKAKIEEIAKQVARINFPREVMAR